MSIINALSSNLFLYASPAIIVLLLSRTSEYATSAIKVAMSVITIYTTGFILQGYGRKNNPDYVSFYQKYQTFNRRNWLDNSKETRELKRELMKYDFEFTHFPIEFKSNTPVVLRYDPPMRKGNNLFETVQVKILDLIAFVAVITFGRRMLYPGSVWILQKAMNPMLQKGRTRMIERLNGERFKIETYDGNHIDTFLVDRRSNSNHNGSKLVICCEGNAGFYEVGIMCTPLDASYSVLGWNHPGFAGSTGIPERPQEIAAIDAVMKFAISRGFTEENIILFGWSIGGFPVSIAAMQYQKVSGVILDASFDDVIPLARSKMPSSWRPIVEHTIRSYFNLNVSENLSQYNGPVLIVRRIQDEIIHTLDTDPVRTNRGNDILIKLLKCRFPKLLDGDAEYALRDYLRGVNEKQWSTVMKYNDVKYLDDSVRRDEYYQSKLYQYIKANNVSSYPIEFDSPTERVQFTLFLAEKHFKNYDSTHCTPLPSAYFVEAWDIFSLSYPSSSFNSGPAKSGL